MVEMSKEIPDEAPLIHMEGLVKSFGENQVLRGVDLSVNRGESLVLIGISGSGKSVLLKCLLSLIRADQGRIVIEGEDYTTVGGARHMAFLRRFGVQFQKSGLFDSLPVWENVAFRLLQDSSLSRKEAQERALAVLEDVGLEQSVGFLYPGELSGGMQKRVGLARAIVSRPQILLLDEPAAGLDPIMSNVISSLILELVGKIGATVISITSDMSVARKLSGRMAMLHEGKIIWCGNGDKVDCSETLMWINLFITAPKGLSICCRHKKTASPYAALSGMIFCPHSLTSIFCSLRKESTFCWFTE